MRRTRSSKALEDDQTSPSTAEDQSTSTSTPATPSFKGQLSLSQYGFSSTNSTKRTSIRTSPEPRDSKRVRTTTAVVTKTATSRPVKKQKSGSYAAPSKYAHLAPLVDILEPDLICVCVGTNPGVQTATAGHAYAHPSNHFWKLLHASGMTDRRLKPAEDRSLPALYCIGNTNIVDRPSLNAAELSKAETSAGTANLDAKFLKYKPEAVLIVGKGIWEAIWRYRYGRNIKASEFAYGWQDKKHNMGKSVKEVLDDSGRVWQGSRVFVTTSTSGLAANLTPAEKEAIWRPFGEWVQKRRTERGFVPKRVGEDDVHL